MFSRTLHHASVGAARSAAEVESYLGPLTEISPLAPEMAGPASDTHDIAEARGLGCIRGLRYALAIEAACGVLIYVLWHFWHILIH